MANTRTWYLLHRWSSLITTVFLLVLCLTGLPLIFRDEIEDWARTAAMATPSMAGTPLADLDQLVDSARGAGGLFPGEAVRWISLEDDKPEVWIALAPPGQSNPALNHVVRFDAHTGRVLAQRASAASATPTFIGVVFWLHKNLLAGAVGEWLLAAMGMLLMVALISGAVLYGPFMRKLRFGSIRHGRGNRLRWLDLHNLLGISTLAWLSVVGLTGVLNEISEPLYAQWRVSALNSLLRPDDGMPLPAELSSVEAAVDAVTHAMPGMKVRSVRYPDKELGSERHYLIWAIGNSPLRSRLFQPALVDAATGQVSVIAETPWYLTAVQLARPLHFGDYGGLPLKIIWAAMDLAVILILWSGIRLWWKAQRHQAAGRRFDQ